MLAGGITLFRFIRLRQFGWVMAVGGLFFCCWVIGLVWSGGELSPLFLQNLPFMSGSADTLIHATCLNIHKTYGVFSSAIDGLELAPYHFGSYWLFLYISQLLNITPIDFYHLAYPIIFIPLLVNAFLCFAYDYREYRLKDKKAEKEASGLFWLIFFIGLIGFLPSAPKTPMGPQFGWSRLFVSESYTLALTMVFILFSMTLNFLAFTKKEGSILRKKKVVYDNSFLVFFPLFVGLIIYTKTSTAPVLLFVYGYLLLRNRAFLSKRFLISYFSTLVICAAYLYYVMDVMPAYSLRLDMFSLLKGIDKSIRPFFFLLHFFWAMVFVWAVFRVKKIDTFKKIKQALNNRSILDVEVVVLGCLVGSIPMFLIATPHRDTIYFSLDQMHVSLALVMGLAVFFSDWEKTILSFCKKLKERPWHTMAGLRLTSLWLFIILSPFLACVIHNTAESMRRFWDHNMEVREIAMKSDSEYQQKYEMIGILKELNKIPVDKKKEMALYIPRSNRFYWHMTRCYGVAFVAQALSGIAMINGFPPKVCRANFITSEFYPDRDLADVELGREQICEKARAKGFKEIIKISKERDRIVKQKVRC